LGRSHKRTMGALEENSTAGSRSSILEVRPKPTPRDPKDQILPSDQEVKKQEAKSKERKYVEDPVTKKHFKFCTRTCILVAAVGLVCLSGLVAVTFLLPMGGTNTASVTGPGQEGVYTPPTGSDMDAIPDSRSERETAEDMLKSVTTFFRNTAFTIGNELHPKEKKADNMQFLFPDYAFSSIHEDTVSGWKVPQYDGLYSRVEYPMVDIQPILWDTKRSGSKTLLDILTYCGRLVLASESAIGHEEAETIEIFSSPDNAGHFANVNSETKEGLIRANQLGLVDSELIHVIATREIAFASELFMDKIRTGRVFGILRDPIEQALSDFHMRKALPLDNPDRLPEDLTLSQFIESDRLISNPLTKALANVTDGTILTESHVLAAKKMLHERVIVGLNEAFDESVRRFFQYFGWKIHDDVCLANFEAARDHRNEHEQIDESSHEGKTLADRQWADKEVYEYAKTIVFPNQEGLRASSA